LRPDEATMIIQDSNSRVRNPEAAWREKDQTVVIAFYRV
jgi:hypothetical protein